MPGDARGGPRPKFSQDQRLKQAWEFERARREGQRLVSGCLILNCRLSDDQKTSRLGVVTSNKIGTPVVRSRTRRLLREVFRVHQNDFKRVADMVLIARNSIAEKEYADVERDFLRALKQARLI